MPSFQGKMTAFYLGGWGPFFIKVSSASAVELIAGFCFAFIFVVSLLSMVDTWESGEELGLKVDVPSLRRLPCLPVTAHTYDLIPPENTPSEASSQRLTKSHLLGNRLSSLCDESWWKSFGELTSSSSAKHRGKPNYAYQEIQVQSGGCSGSPDITSPMLEVSQCCASGEKLRQFLPGSTTKA